MLSLQYLRFTISVAHPTTLSEPHYEDKNHGVNSHGRHAHEAHVPSQRHETVSQNLDPNAPLKSHPTARVRRGLTSNDCIVTNPAETLVVSHKYIILDYVHTNILLNYNKSHIDFDMIPR